MFKRPRKNLSFLITVFLLLFSVAPPFGFCETSTKAGPTFSSQGIGVFISKTGSGCSVTGLVKGSPAGSVLQIGDVILMINGVFTESRSVSELSLMLQPPPGTRMNVMIDRRGVKMSYSLQSTSLYFEKSDIVGAFIQTQLVPPGTAANVAVPTSTPGIGSRTAAPAGSKFIGSKKSSKNVFHTMDCQHAKRIEAENATYFFTAKEAVARGYIPCKVCSPK